MTKKKEEDVVQPTEDEVREPEKMLEPDSTVVADTNAAAARLEAANADQRALMQQQQAMAVEATLAGKAGVNTTPRLSAEQKSIAAAKAMLAGTGYGEELFPDAK